MDKSSINTRYDQVFPLQDPLPCAVMAPVTQCSKSDASGAQTPHSASHAVEFNTQRQTTMDNLFPEVRSSLLRKISEPLVYYVWIVRFWI